MDILQALHEGMREALIGIFCQATDEGGAGAHSVHFLYQLEMALSLTVAIYL